MDNENSSTDMAVITKAAGRGLPKSAAFPVSTAADKGEGGAIRPFDEAHRDSAAQSLADPSGRDSVFRQLVAEDADITGLVAYSIYKQNKLDWMAAFQHAKGRAPNADEGASYIIGEGTPRRIGTYRQLAKAMLAGAGSKGNRSASGGLPLAEEAGSASRHYAFYALIATLAIVCVVLVAHFTVTSR